MTKQHDDVTRAREDAATALRRLAEKHERQIADGGEGLSAIEVYDAGQDALGVCELCGAWPGERHHLLESDDECPRDDGTLEGQVYAGRFEAGDLPALRAIGSLMMDAAREIEDRPRVAAASLRRLAERIEGGAS